MRCSQPRFQSESGLLSNSFGAAFLVSGSPVLYSRYSAYTSTVLLVVSSGSRARSLGEAFRNCATGDFRLSERSSQRLSRTDCSAHPILDDFDEFHGCLAFKAAAVARRANCSRRRSGLILLNGLVPSVRYIYSKSTSPFSIRYYAQGEVAVSRFLRHVVAGQEHPGPPRLEHNEFNRIEGIPDAPDDTFVCQDDAYSIIHLFLRDYDDDKIMSFCAGYPFFCHDRAGRMECEQKGRPTYVPTINYLKLIWERTPKTERIIRCFNRSVSMGQKIRFHFPLEEGLERSTC